MTGRRWDPAPLVAATGNTLRDTAHILGIDPSNLCRPLTTNQADRYASRLGLHPATIWGLDWWTDTDDD